MKFAVIMAGLCLLVEHVAEGNVLRNAIDSSANNAESNGGSTDNSNGSPADAEPQDAPKPAPRFGFIDPQGEDDTPYRYINENWNYNPPNYPQFGMGNGQYQWPQDFGYPFEYYQQPQYVGYPGYNFGYPQYTSFSQQPVQTGPVPFPY